MNALNLPSHEFTPSTTKSLVPAAVFGGLFLTACVVLPMWVQSDKKQEAMAHRMDVCLANSPACDLPWSDVDFAKRHLRNVRVYEQLEASNLRAWDMQRKAEEDAAERQWQKDRVEMDKELGLTP